MSQRVQECLGKEHFEYIRELAEVGASARRGGPRSRERAQPYPSVRAHIQEAYEKVWKDVAYGIVLVTSQQVEGYISELVEAPLGRVPKQLPDRTLSTEGRMVHAMLSANAATSKRDRPPAVQPRHRQVARHAIWHRARHPGVPLLCAKRDLSRAFKWIDIKPSDVGDFGTSLPGTYVGLEGDVRIVNLAMVFGWTGAPGNYMMLALAARDYHECHRPAQPCWHDDTHFRSE